MVPVRLRYNARELKYRIEHALRRGYTETLPDGMHVFLNPYATNASPIGPFKGREIANHRFDLETKTYGVDAPDGFLFQKTGDSPQVRVSPHCKYALIFRPCFWR
jgi:hypothetical protein